MLVGFRAADHQPAAEELLIVQFFHRTSGFVDGLHLHKCETFRALVMAIAYNLRILHVSDAIE
jgi:hypothetical protein